ASINDVIIWNFIYYFSRIKFNSSPSFTVSSFKEANLISMLSASNFNWVIDTQLTHKILISIFCTPNGTRTRFRRLKVSYPTYRRWGHCVNFFHSHFLRIYTEELARPEGPVFSFYTQD